MRNIEVELRSFIDKGKYLELEKYFNKNADFKGEARQITYYYNSSEDLRIQKSDTHSKIWLKSGRIHDESRQEIEIVCKRDDFNKLHNIFQLLGYKKEIEWRRIRKKFQWDEIKISLDYTEEYAYIVEMEIVTDGHGKDQALKKIKNKFNELGIEITSKESQDKQYNYYKKNWKELLNAK